jgi:transposase-like protein
MFKGRHFEQSVIILCVRWYLTCGLSLRNLNEIMAERGISVDNSTIHRWVVHFAPRGAVQPAQARRHRQTACRRENKEYKLKVGVGAHRSVQLIIRLEIMLTVT